MDTCDLCSASLLIHFTSDHVVQECNRRLGGSRRGEECMYVCVLCVCVCVCAHARRGLWAVVAWWRWGVGVGVVEGERESGGGGGGRGGGRRLGYLPVLLWKEMGRPISVIFATNCAPLSPSTPSVDHHPPPTLQGSWSADGQSSKWQWPRCSARGATLRL